MAEAGGRSQRRRDQTRRRNRIIAISVAAVVGVALVAGGIVVLTAEDEPSTTSASSTRKGTTTTSSSSTTTTAPPTSTTIVPRSPNPVVALAQQYDGYYAGTWKTTAGATGGASLELRIDPAGSIAITGTFDGDFFGTGASLPRTIQSTVAIGDPNAPVATSTEAFGQVTGKLDPSLALVLDAPNVPDDKVKSFTMTGRLREDHTGFDATYTITYKNGQTTQGTVTTQCTPDRQRPSEVTTLCTPA